MIIFRLLEFVALVSFIIIVVTQIIVPAWHKRALFPLFRKQGELEKALAEYKQRKVERELQVEVSKIKKEK